MVSERPNYLPPITVRNGAHRETAGEGTGTINTSLASVSRSTSGASKARSALPLGHAPRSPSAYSTTFSIPSIPGATREALQSTSPPPLVGGTTHAGGILPSSSFFHPSRPTYYTDTGASFGLTAPSLGVSRSNSNTVGTHRPPPPSSDQRPESSGSDSFAQHSIATSEEPALGNPYGPHAPGPGGGPAALVLTGDNNNNNNNSNINTRQLPAPTVVVAGANDASDLIRAFSTKVSREPLLPIGQRPKPVPAARPTIPVVGTGSGVPKLHTMGIAGSGISGISGYGRYGDMNGSKGEDLGSLGAGLGLGPKGMRNSLEKFLRRTLSNDTQMAEDTSYSYAHSTPAGGTTHELAPSMEDLEMRARGVRESEDLEFNFKAHGVLVEDEEDDVRVGRTEMRELTQANSNSAYSTLASRRQRASLLRSRYPGFDPVPPSLAGTPPAERTPLVKGTQSVRNYAVHPSRNRFFLRGRLLTGGDSVWPFMFSLFIVVGLAATWSGTTAVWWWHNESPAVTIVGVYLCLLTMANMGATAFSDPGILPRGLDPDPPYPPSSSNGATNAPLPRDLKVRSGIVRVKYCQTCKIYRPPRSSHCRMCDNCVDGCDHHCQWVNNCVGRRNYTSFILFLSTSTLTLIYMLTTAALHLTLQAHRSHLSARRSLSKGAGSALVFAVGALVLWPVLGLLGYHARLLLLNLTTIEQIRNSAHRSVAAGREAAAGGGGGSGGAGGGGGREGGGRGGGGGGGDPPNPFALGSWGRNLGEMMCRARGMSWLDAAGVAVEDRREGNPGSEVK